MVEEGADLYEESEPDYSSLDKYFIKDDKIIKDEKDKGPKVIVEDISISESPFRQNSYEEKEVFEEEAPSVEEDPVNYSRNLSEEKKKFMKSMSEDSLSLDTCSKLTKN